MRRARIFRPDYDATNGGITAKVNHIVILAPGEAPPADYRGEEHLLFVEENRSGVMGGTKPGEPAYWAARPLKTPEGMCGPMFGGNLAVAAYDGKPERVYHVHDRFETWEQYKENA